MFQMYGFQMCEGLRMIVLVNVVIDIEDKIFHLLMEILFGYMLHFDIHVFVFLFFREMHEEYQFQDIRRRQGCHFHYNDRRYILDCIGYRIVC